MRYDDDENAYILSTGKKKYAHDGIIGINPELDIHEGYDGTIWMDYMADDRKEEWGEDIPTNAELIEIADYAIGLWQQFKQKWEAV